MADSIPEDWTEEHRLGFVRGWNSCIQNEWAERNQKVGELFIELDHRNTEIAGLKKFIKDRYEFDEGITHFSYERPGD